MTQEYFTAGLMQSVIRDNLLTYRELFTDPSPDSVSDAYWKRSLALYRTLTPDQQATFFEVIRQVAVDTTANILGVIDGVSFIEGGGEGFTLVHGRNEKISGDLQSLFLLQEEQRKGDDAQG